MHGPPARRWLTRDVPLPADLLVDGTSVSAVGVGFLAPAVKSSTFGPSRLLSSREMLSSLLSRRNYLAVVSREIPRQMLRLHQAFWDQAAGIRTTWNAIASMTVLTRHASPNRFAFAELCQLFDGAYNVDVCVL